MVGLSGSGKSTTARSLAAQAQAVHLRSDAIRKHIAGVPLHEKGGDEIYTAAMSDRTYERLIELGGRLASNGYRVILDAKFDRRAKRQAVIATAKTKNLNLTFLHCTAPIAVLAARLNDRQGDIADANTAILAKQSLEPFDPATPVITLDTTQATADIQQQLARVFLA